MAQSSPKPRLQGQRVFPPAPSGQGHRRPYDLRQPAPRLRRGAGGACSRPSPPISPTPSTRWSMKRCGAEPKPTSRRASSGSNSSPTLRASRLRAPDSQKLVDSLCRQVMDQLGCQAFFNFLAVEEMGRLMLNAYAGIPEEEARKIEWLDYGVAVCGCAARDACRIVAEHIPTTPDQRTESVNLTASRRTRAIRSSGPKGRSSALSPSAPATGKPSATRTSP